MLLEHRTFLVKEQVAFMKLSDHYDIFDPDTGDQIGFAKEQISTVTKLLRMLVNKQLLPTTIVIQENADSEPVATLHRGVTLLRHKVNVLDQNGNSVGFFKSKLFSLGGGFTVHNPAGDQIADVQGNWKGWDFKLVDLQGNELGKVTKKWAGAMKEFFTSADNYIISINESIGSNSGLAVLLLAAGLAIDIVFKERK